jgi:hypothetical protein
MSSHFIADLKRLADLPNRLKELQGMFIAKKPRFPSE